MTFTLQLQVCLCMSTHKVNWLALTSHHKWIFFRLNPIQEGMREPYIPYSSVEMMEGNTRPLLALLAMLLTAMGEIKDVDSNVDTMVPLPMIEAEDQPSSESSKEDKNKDDPYRGSGPVTKKQHNLRPHKSNNSCSADSAELLVKRCLIHLDNLPDRHFICRLRGRCVKRQTQSGCHFMRLMVLSSARL